MSDAIVGGSGSSWREKRFVAPISKCRRQARVTGLRCAFRPRQGQLCRGHVDLREAHIHRGSQATLRQGIDLSQCQPPQVERVAGDSEHRLRRERLVVGDLDIEEHLRPGGVGDAGQRGTAKGGTLFGSFPVRPKSETSWFTTTPAAARL